MWLIEIILGIAELWCSWRLYVCLAAAAGVAVALHNAIPDQVWVWFISLPVVIAGIALGVWWQTRRDNA